jgi:hypothetical protein
MTVEDNFAWSTIGATTQVLDRLTRHPVEKHTRSCRHQEGHHPVAKSTWESSFLKQILSFWVKKGLVCATQGLLSSLLTLKKIKIWFRNKGNFVAYLDADWAGCPDTRRSTSGSVCFFG